MTATEDKIANSIMALDARAERLRKRLDVTASHTPGPKVQGSGFNHRDGGFAEIVIDGKHYPAHLAAAAPKMLAALEDVIRFVDSVGSEHINRVPFVAARAAIAEAKGGAA
jgi:hypothetical protein